MDEYLPPPSNECLPGRWKPDMLRPGVVGMRGSMVLRLRPCMRDRVLVHLSYRVHPPTMLASQLVHKFADIYTLYLCTILRSIPRGARKLPPLEKVASFILAPVGRRTHTHTRASRTSVRVVLTLAARLGGILRHTADWSIVVERLYLPPRRFVYTCFCVFAFCWGGFLCRCGRRVQHRMEFFFFLAMPYTACRWWLIIFWALSSHKRSSMSRKSDTPIIPRSLLFAQPRGKQAKRERERERERERKRSHPRHLGIENSLLSSIVRIP